MHTQFILMTVTLTGEKIAKVQGQCQQLLNKTCCSITELAMVIGTLVATEPGVDLAPIYYRRLEREKAEKLKLARSNFDA